MARTVVITKQGIPGSAATGYSPGGTDVAVSDGGTGASSAAAARTNLGVPATTDLTSHTGNTSNPHSVTKAQVGLSNVDNTSDANKPVSTAQAAADAALDSRLDVLEADSGWILPTLETDVTVQTVWLHLGYRKIRGIVYWIVAVDVANPAADKLLFTLPVGYRPGISGVKRLIAGDSSLVRINGSNGEVRANTPGTLFLVNVSYPADN